MDLRQLEYFVRVAEFGSFTKASNALGVAQPALSRQIRQLEVELRHSLLLRNGRGATPTEAGKLLLAHAQGILHQVRRTHEELSRLHGALSGRVAIGMPPTLARRFILPLSKAFQKRMPDALVSFSEGLSVAMHEQLTMGRLDIALLYGGAAATVPGLLVEPLFDDELMLVCSARQRRQEPQGARAPGGAKSYTLREVAEFPLVIPSRPNAIRVHVEGAMAQARVRPSVALEVDAIGSILELVAAGVGSAVLSAHALTHAADRKRFTLHPFRPRLMVQASIATSTMRPVTVTQQAAVKLIREVSGMTMASRWNDMTMRTENDTLTLHERLRRHARTTPDKAAFIWYGAKLSYQELDRASDAFSLRLRELGVKHGEPVVLYLGNCPQYAVAHFGIQKLGAVVVPCGPLSREAELEYQLRDLGARVIVAAQVLMPRVHAVCANTRLTHAFAVDLRAMLPETPTLPIPEDLRAGDARVSQGASMGSESATLEVIGFEECSGLLAFAQAGSTNAISGASPVAIDDVALMTYTSGTTGMPKGAMLSHRNVAYKTRVTAQIFQTGPDDVLLAIAPMYHIAGMLMGLDVTIHAGATAVLLHRFEPLAAIRAIETHRVTSWYSIAPMNLAVLEHPEATKADLSGLRINPVTSFGITFTKELAERFRAVAPNAISFEAAYGLSETHTMDTCMPPDAVRWGTHGRPVPGNQIRIVDPQTGEECVAGATGEITIRGKGVFLGYWNRPDATATALRDGWLHTGDLGKIDEEGYLSFLGRNKEMIKVSGYSVFPEEVETLLVRHPGIAQAAVLGIPDETRGEAVRAWIVRAANEEGTALDEQRVIDWARENMTPYKAPRSVRFIDALPTTGSGKVLRRLLRERETD